MLSWCITLIASFALATNLPANVSKAYEVVILPIVKQSGDVVVTIPLGERVYVLTLKPHSVRASNYQVLVQGNDGSLMPVEPGPVRTLRGSLADVPGSVVAGSLLDDGLYARILFPNDEEYWLEPIGSDKYIVYSGDIISGEGTCGVEGNRFRGEVNQRRAFIPTNKGHRHVELSAYLGVEDNTFRGEINWVPFIPIGSSVAELAVDSDYEYYLDYGSIVSVENRINTIVNAVNVQYERDVSITHVITTIIVRTAEPDPYDEIFSGLLLMQFQDHWLTNHSNILRDVAQLFTGKDLYNDQIGYAWAGSVCTDDAFSVVQSDWSANFSQVVDLSAHELGHNWSANHCGWDTMNPWITGANAFDSVCSAPEIVTFRNSRDCLD